MKIIFDEEKYESFQDCVLEYIVMSIRESLAGNGVADDKIQDITGEIAFSIGAIIDSSRIMVKDGEDVLPFLTFLKSEKDRDTLIVNEGGTYIHELAYGVTNEIFEKE